MFILKLKLFMKLTALCLLLAACGPQQIEVVTAPEVPTPAVVIEAVPEPAPTKGTLTVALTTIPNSIDMAIASERNAQNVASQVFDSLVWIDDNGNKVPALAERWDISDDGTEYTFYLRPGVTFHNGEPLTADAVVFSWERGSQAEMHWSDRWQRADLVEKIDDSTVRVRTPGPDPLFLTIVAEQWGIVPPQYLAEVGEEGFAARPIGAGPFMFSSWKDDRIVLDAYPDYWEVGSPKVDSLVFHPLPDVADREIAILTGNIDIATRLDPEIAQGMLGLQGVNVVRYPVDRVYYIAFNNLTSGLDQPTLDPRVRLAMNHAVNRQAIVDQIFNGFARLSTGLVTPANLGYDTSLEPMAFDQRRAQSLLAEAGYPDGFTIEFACPTGAYAYFEAVCEVIRDDLAAVGIIANLQLIESAEYWDLEGQKALPPIFGDSWSERSGEALPRLGGALGGWDASFSAWSDPVIDALLKEIAVTVNDELRAELYVAVQQRMVADPPFIYLYEPVTFEAVRVGVQDYRPRAAENYYLKHTWLLEP